MRYSSRSRRHRRSSSRRTFKFSPVRRRRSKVRRAIARGLRGGIRIL